VGFLLQAHAAGFRAHQRFAAELSHEINLLLSSNLVCNANPFYSRNAVAYLIEALCYKLEDRGFHSRLDYSNFQFA
jgi:hypothetical protein